MLFLTGLGQSHPTVLSYCHVSAFTFSRLTCATATAFSGGGPRSLWWLHPSPTPTPSLACGHSLSHWACRDCATRTLACPYRSLRTPEWPNRTLIHRARSKKLCFDTLRNNIWEIFIRRNRVNMAQGESLEGQNGNVWSVLASLGKNRRM